MKVIMHTPSLSPATIQGMHYRWQLPTDDQKTVNYIAATYNLSFPIAHVLATRGISDRAALDEFLFSSLEKDVAHPSKLMDAEKAVERILRAIENKEKILVAGDYDVDGITSSALMLRCLLPLGADINFFLPNRVKDGYGLSTSVINKAADSGYTVVITVDNGITAFEPARVAKERGIDLIITDHHRQHDHLPDAYAIVNPNRTECPYPFKALAGVGVSFKLLCLLYEKKGLTIPPKAYELLLLGTIADVVPLLGENRFWVRHGLHYIAGAESFSLKILKQNSKITKPILSSLDIGFGITPQINALGRLEDARQGVRFLIDANQKEVEEVGKILLELNQARKDIERSIVNEVEGLITQKRIDVEKEKIIVAASHSWPPGVIGLVASRIMNNYARPTILLHLTKDGLAKGSCRSIPAFNLFNALTECKDLLIQFGGHSMAAGLSLKVENIPALKERLEALVNEQVSPEDLVVKLTLDGQATLPDLNKQLMKDMHHLEPFGNQNSQPLFYIKDVVLTQKPTILKGLHVKCMVFAEGVVKPVIFFNKPELFTKLMELDATPFHLAAQVTENHWNDKVSIELIGLDIALPTENV